ncbi:MAG: CBS domain-containing protein [Euryarchaeota archaeon]|nr:CBS domain-containing protein [Euryarchaeota archaeon]
MSKVRDYMSSEVVCVSPRDSVQAVVERMRHTGHDGFPVADGDRVVGYISSSDLLLVEPGATVRSVMTRGPIVAHPEMDLNDAARVIFRSGISKLPVVDDGGRLVGIVTNIDVLRSQIERVDERRVEELRRRLRKRGLPVAVRRERVAVHGLVPTQGRIHADELQGRTYELQRGLAEPVVVLRTPRRTYLVDGHHRAVAAMRLGIHRIDAYVLDVPRETRWGRGAPRSLQEVVVADDRHPLVALTERYRGSNTRRVR